MPGNRLESFLLQKPPFKAHQGQNKGGTMSEISMSAMRAVPASMSADQSLSVIALFSCVGLLVSVALIAFGIDLGSALI